MLADGQHKQRAASFSHSARQIPSTAPLATSSLIPGIGCRPRCPAVLLFFSRVKWVRQTVGPGRTVRRLLYCQFHLLPVPMHTIFQKRRSAPWKKQSVCWQYAVDYLAQTLSHDVHGMLTPDTHSVAIQTADQISESNHYSWPRGFQGLRSGPKSYQKGLP